MPASSPLQTGRFKRLARRTAEVWQCTFRRLPMWIDHEDDASLPPTRGFGVVWRSVRTGVVHVDIPANRDLDVLAECAVASCMEFGLKWQKQLEGRPATIHVTDAWLQEALAARHADLEAEIVLVPDLNEITAVLRDMQVGASGDTRSNLLDDPAIAPERVRAFADAAADFFRAAPWRYLDNEDLVVVSQPRVPTSVSHISVLGAGGEQFGLSFFSNWAEFERLIRGGGRLPDRAFGVTFGPVDEMPFGDVDLWEDEHLAVAGPLAYPQAMEFRPRGEMRRPTATEMTAMEGLLRAFAQVTEEKLDRGEWTADVSTFDGPVRFELALPDVLNALEESIEDAQSSLGQKAHVQGRLSAFLAKNEFASLDAANEALQKAMLAGAFDPGAGGAPLSTQDLAQEMAGRAMESYGRVRAALARRALSLDANCADAWLALVDLAPTDDEAIIRARHAVDAARRAMGESAFAASVGSFWLVFPTRPYMRAMADLARVLRDAGRLNEAIDIWREMLRLNPNDNQGMRYVLFYALLLQRRHDDLAALVARYEDDGEVTWQFGLALWLFARDGATPDAAAAFARARQANRHVVPFLIGRKALPDRLPDSYQIGGIDEAAYGAFALLPAIDDIDGCADWVKAQASVRKAPTPKRKKT